MSDPDETGVPHDENPGWTEDDVARAEFGPPKRYKAADAIRTAAAELRHQADLLEEQADRIDASELKKAG